MNHIYFQKSLGQAKPLHCINGGPKPYFDEQSYSDAKYYKELKIPYTRNHDMSFDYNYGGSEAIDIHNIFKNFDADENDPKNYSFVPTDEAIQILLKCGMETYYRLGTRIEWDTVKRGIFVPKDFQKWARICEHIILHYNYGWANGFHFGIKYWEIWNEPDLRTPDDPIQPTWLGTPEEYFEMYKVAATYLKSRFPEIQVGGPALGFRLDFADRFLNYIGDAPLDFYSYHIYSTDPKKMLAFTEANHKLLVKYGRGDVPMHLNEFNYVKGFSGNLFEQSVLEMHSQIGGAYVLGTILHHIKSPAYMLNYYGAGMGVFDGLVNLIPMYPKPQYYALMFYSKLYQLGEMVDFKVEEDNLYLGAAVSNNQKGVAICDFSEHRRKRMVSINLDGLDSNTTYSYKLYMVDKIENYRVASEGTLDPTKPFELSLRSYGMAYLEIEKQSGKMK